MKSATSLLNIGNSGLNAARKKLVTTGHNIANANTEGYSRQRATQQTTNPVNYGNVILGTGTKVARVERVHDKLLEENLGSTITEHLFHKERNSQLGQVEIVFNEIDVAGFSDTLNKFFNSFRELSRQPDDEAIRSVVRETAKQLTANVRSTKRALNNLQLGMDKKIQESVGNINLLLRQIGELNVKTTGLENSGGETGDLRDQRDLKIRELSEFLEVRVYQDNQGQYTVNAQGVGALVAGGYAQELVAQKSFDSRAHIPGGVEVHFKDRTSVAVSKKLLGGKLGAIFKTRNNELKGLQERVDDLAFNLANAVNTIHRRGFSNKTVLGSSDAQIRANASEGKVTNIDFFRSPTKRYRAAESLDLSDEVKQDVRNIVTAGQPNSPGDNRVALAITNLQHSMLLDSGTSTFEDFYLKGVGEIGAQARGARVDEEQSLGVLTQNKALKERVSGVSIDEETSNMIRFQHAFDASARVMSVADEMFKTVLGIKKL